jgi:sugar lactone lactonase YvrE
MKPVASLLCALLPLVAGSAAAQTLNSPESLEFDPPRNRVLVSNTQGGNILARAADGTLSVFTAAPASPYGIEILGNVLYVLDSGKLLGYDLVSAAPVLDLAITGASFLNGITSDGADTLWITDFSARKLIRVNVADLANPVQTPLQTLTGITPNGVVFDRAGNRLLIATWSTARVLAYDIAANTAPVTLINVSGYSNIDGITLDCAGAIHIAAWSCPGGGGCLRRFDPPFSLTSAPISEGPALSAPADIDFNARGGQIAIPETSANRVTFAATGCVFGDGFEP